MTHEDVQLIVQAIKLLSAVISLGFFSLVVAISMSR